MKYSCLIVDDEPLALELIESYVSKIPQLEVIAKCSNAINAYEVLKNQKVDLMFLDIQMPNITGIEFLKSVSNAPKVILTTAYRQYAIESYELEVVDYLLKPIPFNRFFKAIDKFLKQVQKGSPIAIISETTKEEKEHVFININKKYHKLNYDDILYIDSLKDYIRIHTNKQSYITKEKISEFEKSLPTFFLRSHRSYIVNTQKITAYTKQDIEIGTIEIPIGVSYKKQVLEVLRKE